MGRKESQIQGRRYPSSEETWKMDLCHLKMAVPAKHLQKNKRASCALEDNVKDEEGNTAVFSEQVASASQMTAAKFLDNIAKLLGMAGEASDAVPAYTQVKIAEAPRLLQLLEEQCPEIWIIIPSRQRPKVGTRLTILWFLLKGIKIVNH